MIQTKAVSANDVGRSRFQTLVPTPYEKAGDARARAGQNTETERKTEMSDRVIGLRVEQVQMVRRDAHGNNIARFRVGAACFDHC